MKKADVELGGTYLFAPKGGPRTPTEGVVTQITGNTVIVRYQSKSTFGGTTYPCYYETTIRCLLGVSGDEAAVAKASAKRSKAAYDRLGAQRELDMERLTTIRKSLEELGIEAGTGYQNTGTAINLKLSLDALELLIGLAADTDEQALDELL